MSQECHCLDSLSKAHLISKYTI
uniref:Transcriptional activator family protein n=1 Tax=Rhizophora mucronata TaxID=61149 RepID=A0A2P2MVL4_RHIMU